MRRAGARQQHGPALPAGTFASLGRADRARVREAAINAAVGAGRIAESQRQDFALLFDSYPDAIYHALTQPLAAGGIMPEAAPPVEQALTAAGVPYDTTYMSPAERAQVGRRFTANVAPSPTLDRRAPDVRSAAVTPQTVPQAEPIAADDGPDEYDPNWLTGGERAHIESVAAGTYTPPAIQSDEPLPRWDRR